MYSSAVLPDSILHVFYCSFPESVPRVFLFFLQFYLILSLCILLLFCLNPSLCVLLQFFLNLSHVFSIAVLPDHERGGWGSGLLPGQEHQQSLPQALAGRGRTRG